jgi:hypothetical protein
MGVSAIRRSLLSAVLLITANVALAESRGSGELKWTHFGVRPLAMGNAYVAVADDFNALFYNPAGLARLKEWDGELLNPTLEVSDSTVSFAEDLSSLASASGGSTDEVLDILEKNTGKNHHFALGLTPHLVFQGFGFGIGAELSTSMTVHREISTNVDFGPRIIAPVSFATNIFEGLDVGGSVKFVARGGVNKEFSINDIQAFTGCKAEEGATADEAKAAEENCPTLDDFVEGGAGAGADFGLLFTPVKTMEPTLGLSITDIGGTPYEKFDVGSGDSTAAPRTRLPSVNTGVSLKPWKANNMYLLTSMDAHAINQPVHYSKKFNIGMEWGYGSIIKVQSGIHQGELSGGFEFDVFLFSCRFATYAEQLGTIAGQDDNLRDRRYTFQLKLLI